MNIPSIITWLRVLIIPIFVLLFLMRPFPHQSLLLALLFAVASFTDWFDGYLARKWNQTSSFGAFLDPVADKLLVAAALILLAVANPIWYLTVAVIIIISREITISALREWMATMGERSVVAVSWIGKWKTAFQMVAITLLLYREPLFNLPIYSIGLLFLLIATFLTLWSMVQYLYATWRVLRKERKQQ